MAACTPPCPCDTRVSFTVSLSTGRVRGTLIAYMSFNKKEYISFSMGASVAVLSAKVNENNAFYSISTENHPHCTLMVFIPAGFAGEIWTPLDDFGFYSDYGKVEIEFDIMGGSPSLYRSDNLIFTNSSAFGSCGWMPIPIHSHVDQISVTSDDPESLIFGPSALCCEEKRENYKTVTFECSDLDLLGFAVCRGALQRVGMFHFINASEIELKQLQFLERLNDLVQKPIMPIIVVPPRSDTVTVTNGYATISCEIFENYVDEFFIPIPHSYKIAVMISTILSFDIYVKNKVTAENLQFCTKGLALYCAYRFIQKLIGEMDFECLRWLMYRKLNACSKNLIISSIKYSKDHLAFDFGDLSFVKAYFFVCSICSFLPESQRDPVTLSQNWPDLPSLVALKNFLSGYMSDSQQFIDYWTKSDLIPTIDVTWDKTQVRHRASLMTSSIYLHTKGVHKRYSCPIHVSTKLYMAKGAFAQDLILGSNPQTYPVRFTVRKLRSTVLNTLKPYPPVSDQGFLFPLVYTEPYTLLNTVYSINATSILNMIKTLSDMPFCQHTALSSLQRLLLREGDDSQFTSLRLLTQLAKDDSVFYTIRCHSILIMLEVLKKDNIFVAEAEYVKESLTELIAEPNDHSSIKFCLLEAEMYLANLKGQSILKTMLLDYSHTALGPSVVKLVARTSKIPDEDVPVVVSLLMEYIQGKDNALVCASLYSLNRLMISFSPVIRSKVFLNLSYSMLEDKVHPRIKIEIARLIISSSLVDCFMEIVELLAQEAQKEEPDYDLIKQVLDDFISGISIADISSIRNHIDIDEFKDKMTSIMKRTCRKELTIDAKIRSLYYLVSLETLEYDRIPDGIVKSVKMEYVNGIEEGMFSDSD